MRRLLLASAALAAVAAVLAALAPAGLRRVVRGNVARDRVAPRLATATTPADVARKRVLCVGCTAGIGLAVARRVAELGGKVTVVGRRDLPAALAGVPRVEFVRADLSGTREAKRLARAVPAADPASFDAVVYTVGILSPATRDTSTEGIEIDLAVSYLSRLVHARHAAARLARGSRGEKPRVFVMGFPGENVEVFMDDMNWETSYDQTKAHFNTIVGNEALVYWLARRFPDVNVFGLNPGLIATDIRANFTGGAETLFGRTLERVVGAIAPSTDDYARDVVVPLLVSPDLETGASGSIFNQMGEPLVPAKFFVEDPAHADAFIKRSEELIARKAGKDVLEE